MTTAYIGLGANIDDPIMQIEIAHRALHALSDTQLTACSSFYGSAPLGPEDQPDFINAVAQIETELSPLSLLDALQQIEQTQGRIKRRHWGERCIDLDILLFGNETLRSERLNLPHHELTKRSFVVSPLLEIAPDLVLPDGQPLSDVQPEFDGDLHTLHRPVIDL